MIDTLQPIVLSGLFGYVLGSLPFGVIICRLMGVSDPRLSGSGNIGATNVARASGYGVGALTLLGDGGKGFVALYGVIALTTDVQSTAVATALIAVVLGHMFPFWLRFRGGKGVATVLGASAALSMFVFVGLIATWATVVWMTRYVSVASIVSAWTLPLWFFVASTETGTEVSAMIVYSAVVVAALITFAHRSNIALLRRGEEEKMLRERKT